MSRPNSKRRQYADENQEDYEQQVAFRFKTSLCKRISLWEFLTAEEEFGEWGARNDRSAGVRSRAQGDLPEE